MGGGRATGGSFWFGSSSAFGRGRTSGTDRSKISAARGAANGATAAAAAASVVDVDVDMTVVVDVGMDRPAAARLGT